MRRIPTLGYEISIPVLAEVGIPDREAVCILGREAAHTRDQMEECTPVPEAGFTAVQEVVCTPVPEAGFTAVPEVVCTRDRGVVCILVQEGGFIQVRAVACTQGPVKTHIEVTYHLGLCLLST